tara:strand:- start:10837 stop:11022 length:186 start_codon:yes stop_codon:yes gene_type:complete
MNYESFDLGLIFINLLFCAFLLYRQNKLIKKAQKVDIIKELIIANIKNPKTSKRILNNSNL